MTITDLQSEWCPLQNQFDSYKKNSLVIKLTAVGIATASVGVAAIGGLGTILLLVL